MAVVKNLTPDVLALFTSSAPPVEPGDEVTVRDENFVGRAWPKSTWEVVEPPTLDGYTDLSTEDAWHWGELVPEPTSLDPGDLTVEQVVEYLATAPDDERTRVIAAETAGKARKGITEWSAS